MSTLVPTRFLFDFEFPLRYRAELPSVEGDLAGWIDDERLPDLGALEGREPFADVWACWNETGLAIACRISGKRRPLQCDPRAFWAGDNLRICTDMRDARTNRRATRYCQQFFFLPTGGGKGGKEPVAGITKIKRARECKRSVSRSSQKCAPSASNAARNCRAMLRSTTRDCSDEQMVP